MHIQQFQVQSVHRLYQRIYGFFLAHNADAVVNAGTDEVIFLHHSAGNNTDFDLFAFSFGNSEADGFIFMFATHGKAPFILGVAAGVICQPDSHRDLFVFSSKSRLYLPWIS